MYSAFRTFCERLLRIPPDPHPPPGDEASTRSYRAAANYFKYLVVIWLLSSGLTILIPLAIEVVLVVVALNSREVHLAWALIPGVILALTILIAVFRLAVLRLNYEKRWYIVTDRSLRVREGVVGVREMTVTFANIQNISISQGPVQRLLGIADLRVDTAGGGGAATQQHAGPDLHVAWFRGIDNAPAVRELIQQRLRQFKDAGLGDHEDVASEVAHSHDSADMIAALREIHAAAQALRNATANYLPNAQR
jgi:membrane protein YdbS with pleckstrin-like domain